MHENYTFNFFQIFLMFKSVLDQITFNFKIYCYLDYDAHTKYEKKLFNDTEYSVFFMCSAVQLSSILTLYPCVHVRIVSYLTLTAFSSLSSLILSNSKSFKRQYILLITRCCLLKLLNFAFYKVTDHIY